jgi:hypothetical protein
MVTTQLVGGGGIQKMVSPFFEYHPLIAAEGLRLMMELE